MKTYVFSDLIASGALRDQDIDIAIGVFDGVHKGHADIFNSLRNTENKTMVITFSRNPKLNSPCLDTMRLRKAYVESFSIDYFTVIDFSMDFSKLSGSEFIRLLCTMCHVRRVVVGEDFKCGYPEKQIMSYDLGYEFASQGSYTEVDIRPAVLDGNGKRISSTMLRQMISSGELLSIKQLSGRPYQVDLFTAFYRYLGQDLVIDSFSLIQLLPPEGRYEGTLALKNGMTAAVEVELSKNQLKIKGVRFDPVYVSTIGLDSINLMNKEW